MLLPLPYAPTPFAAPPVVQVLIFRNCRCRQCVPAASLKSPARPGLARCDSGFLRAFFSAHQVALRGGTSARAARGDVWLHLPLLFVLSAHCPNKCVALG